MTQKSRELDPKLIGQRLQMVRKSRGLTQQEVADRLDMARTTLTAIEKGERAIRADELMMLAELYNESVNRLLRRPEAAEAEPFLVQFRKALSRTKEPEMEHSINEFQKLCEDYVYLEEITDMPLRKKYPPPEVVGPLDPIKRAEDIAIAERNRLGLGDGPITDIKKILETEVGIRIFGMPLPSKVGGLFAYTDRLGACIATNTKHPQDRQLMSLLHEYAHFLTNRTKADIVVLQVYNRVPASERFADAFARIFLMPYSGIQRRFHEIKKLKKDHITLADLLELADLYSVSWQTLLSRLEEMHLIPSNIWEKLVNRQDFRVMEARDQYDIESQSTRRTSDLVELPNRYRALAAIAWKEEKLSEGQLTLLLRIDRLSVREFIEHFFDRSEINSRGIESYITFENLSQPID